MVADHVPARCERCGRGGRALDTSSDLEEGRTNAAFSQDLGNPRRVRLVGAVVESERDDALVADASPWILPEGLTGGRQENPVEAAYEGRPRDGCQTYACAGPHPPSSGSSNTENSSSTEREAVVMTWPKPVNIIKRPHVI